MNRRRSPPPKKADANASYKALARLRKLAWLLDSSIRLPGGFRVGLEAVIGLIPFLGDAVGVIFSAWIVIRAAGLGVPRSLLMRMVLNVAIEGIVGLIPVLGDVFDAAWKANQRNVELLERYIHQPGNVARSSRWFVGLSFLGLGILLILPLAAAALFVKWALPRLS